METRFRTLTKAVTWQALGFVAMIALGFLLTGSISQAGQFALGSATLGFVSYIIHERIWAGIRWGRTGHKESAGQSANI